MKDTSVLSPPTDYNSWLEYLDSLESGYSYDGFEEVLVKSSCPEYRGIKSYLHQRIEKTVNAIINSCIKDLHRNVTKYVEGNEISGMHILFKRFAKRIEKCMFFCYIPFLDGDYKKELFEAAKSETYKFWNAMLASVKADVLNNNNTLLEEELFLIERITLFENIEI